MGFLKERHVPFLGIKITYANDKNALSTWSNGARSSKPKQLRIFFFLIKKTINIHLDLAWSVDIQF